MKDSALFLIGQECDTRTASNIAAKYDQPTLEAMSETDLQAIDVPAKAVENIKKKRPPIPASILKKLLSDNLYTCCICKDKGQEVVVHHISPYAVEGKHEIHNLAVLCVKHHSTAHAEFKLAQNLTPDMLHEFKRGWEERVIDVEVWIAGNRHKIGQETLWDWVNWPRLLELCAKEKIGSIKCDAGSRLESENYINADGEFLGNWPYVKIDGGYFTNQGAIQNALNSYISRMVEVLAGKKSILDISKLIDNREVLKKMIVGGEYVCLRRDFEYKYEGDMYRVFARSQAVKLEFSYDPWFCLSSTARLNHDQPKMNQVLFGVVRSVTNDEYEMTILISPIGTSIDFSPMQRLLGGFFPAQDEDAELHLLGRSA